MDDVDGDVDDDHGAGFTGNSDPSTSVQCSGADGLKVWSPTWDVRVQDKEDSLGIAAGFGIGDCGFWGSRV